MQVIGHILVPTAFGSASLAALRYAVALARAVQAEVSLLHVVAGGGSLGKSMFGRTRSDDERARLEQERVDGLHRKLESFARSVPWITDLRVRLVVRNGNPVDEIPACAAEDGIDLMVLGASQPLGSLANRLAGGTLAERVLRAAPCPVLILRHDDEELATALIPSEVELSPS